MIKQRNIRLKGHHSREIVKPSHAVQPEATTRSGQVFWLCGISIKLRDKAKQELTKFGPFLI